MVSREDLILELVKQGVTSGAAASRVTKAASRLKEEDGFAPVYDRKHNNAVSYNDEDAAKMRAKLGLTKPTPTKTDSPPPEPKTESKDIEQLEEEKPDQEVKPPAPETSVNSKTITETQQTTPPPRSVEDLAEAQGPEKQEEEKVDKPEPKAKPSEEAKKVPSWVWFACGGVALVVVGWLIAHRKKGAEQEQEKSSEALESVSEPSRSGVNLADQYRVY